MKIIKLIAQENIKIIMMRIPKHERRFFNCSKEYVVEISKKGSKLFNRFETNNREKAENFFEKEVKKIAL